MYLNLLEPKMAIAAAILNTRLILGRASLSKIPLPGFLQLLTKKDTVMLDLDTGKGILMKSVEERDKMETTTI